MTASIWNFIMVAVVAGAAGYWVAKTFLTLILLAMRKGSVASGAGSLTSPRRTAVSR